VWQEERGWRTRRLPPPPPGGGGRSHGLQSVRDGGGLLPTKGPFRHATLTHCAPPSPFAHANGAGREAIARLLPRRQVGEVDRTDICPCETVGAVLPARGPFRHATLDASRATFPTLPRGAGRRGGWRYPDVPVDKKTKSVTMVLGSRFNGTPGETFPAAGKKAGKIQKNFGGSFTSH
jgi:hypothetical protein